MTLKSKLQKGKVEVTFTKVDGTTRVMNCTLNEKFIPKSDHEVGESTKKKNDDVQVVYDLDKQAWRSFRAAFVIDWRVI